MADGGPERVTDPVSLGVVRDMSTPHAQAVRMSAPPHRRSADPDLNYLAFDILSTQQGQIEIMTGWPDVWEQSQSGSDEPMAWMGHDGSMPGMASDAEIERLNTLPVAEMQGRRMTATDQEDRTGVSRTRIAQSKRQQACLAAQQAKAAQARRARLTVAGSIVVAAAVVALALAQGGGDGPGVTPAASSDGLLTGPPPWPAQADGFAERVAAFGFPPVGSAHDVELRIQEAGDPPAASRPLAVASGGERGRLPPQARPTLRARFLAFAMHWSAGR